MHRLARPLILTFGLAFLLTALAVSPARSAPSTRPFDANRLAYLDEPCDPYYVGRHFPKLVTPQWVGEEGVDAVVVLAIDDMRDSAKYEAWLRPVLDRLKQIDGRTPVSIMANRVDPADPQLQTWLKEGLSIECHTFDHPCPLLKDGDIKKAGQTYDMCVELMAKIPGNKPVAFRTPCCDSRNTFSPQVVTALMIPPTGKEGRFLTIDSSVFNILTPNDPELPRELVTNPDGSERFRRYLPFPNFINTIEDYPYPYVINNSIWEFPCVVPSDWEAQNVQKPFNPRTVEDWKAALDAIVIKQGVFTAVFHPHNWMKPEQVVEFIDYSHKKYGKRVKFLNFRECQERIDKNLLLGQPIREPKKGGDNGVRLLDVNDDGYLDVVIANVKNRITRIYLPATNNWAELRTPFVFESPPAGLSMVRFGFLGPDRSLVALSPGSAWRYTDGWRLDDNLALGNLAAGRLQSTLLRDVDGDGQSELLYPAWSSRGILRFDHRIGWTQAKTWPDDANNLVRTLPNLQSERFADINGDGMLDLIQPLPDKTQVFLFPGWDKPWSAALKLPDSPRVIGVPNEMLPEVDTQIRLAFTIRNRAFWWVNEHTDKLPDLAAKVSFDDLLANQPPTPKSPAASARTIKVPPGFTAQLVAAEPLVQDPVHFAFGPDGVLWVVEMGDYPLSAGAPGKPGGRVKRLTDTDGDGVYDKATTFLENLPYPSGVTPWRDGVLVTAAPDILFARDTNADGVADQRDVLFTGFSTGNPQHRINGLTWGLDNWLHGSNSHSTGHVRSTKTGKTVDIRGRDFRLRPDTGEFETTTGISQFHRAQDDWGHWFGNDNTHPLFHYALDERYLRRNPHLAATIAKQQVPETPAAPRVYPISRTLERFNQPTMANHITSACSTIFYRDDLFGPAYAGHAFVSEPVHNLITRLVIRQDGLAFHGSRAPEEQQSEFLASSDNWFRPTSIRVGPDGALWVADMYRQVIEHPEWIPKETQATLDLRAGHDRGRIYRVYPAHNPPRAVPRMDTMTVAQLVASFESPSGWQRDMAQQLLLERQDQSAVPPLRKLAAESKQPLARLHALCTLDALNALSPDVLRPALKDDHPAIRMHAVRLAEKTPADLIDALLPLAADADLHVRKQVAYTLGELDDPRAGEALATFLAANSGEPLLQAAAMSSLNAKNLTATIRTIGQSGKPISPALVGSLTRMVAAAQDVNATTALLLAIAADPKNGGYETWQFHALAAFGDSIQQKDAYLAHLGEPELTPHATALLKAVAMTKSARSVALDPKQDESRRVAGISLLGRFGNLEEDDRQAIAELLKPTMPDSVQAAAVAAAVRSWEDESPGKLLLGWKTYSPRLRGVVLDVLLARPKWIVPLLAALDRGDVKAADLDAARRQKLLTNKDAAIVERAKKLLADVVNPDRQKVIDAFKPALALAGDATRGQAVFTKACATCHVAGGAGNAVPIGNAVGPDIAAVGDKSPEGLLAAILDPNRAVEAKYVGYVIETKAGDTLNGILSAESANAVTLLGPDGKATTVLRADMVKLRAAGVSLMPEGLESGLSQQDVADLIAFLRGVRPAGKPKTFEGNQPALVLPADGGVLKLSPKTAEISGDRIQLEKQYGNLGWWSSEADQAVWSTQPARAGVYDVWIDYACPPSDAGNRLLVQVGSGESPGTRLNWTVEPTTNWDTYRKVKIGQLTLAAGRQRITVRADGALKGALIDLREVELTPGK